ncbi:MAG: hypothetical protein WBD30_01695 [Bacteroidota bacterium]
MKSVFRKTLLLVSVGAIGLFFMGGRSSFDRDNVQKPEVFMYKFLDGNRLNCTCASDGEYCDSRRTSASGLEWPRGSNRTSIFTAGYWIAGRHRPSGNLRTANIDYSTEYHSGPFLEGEVYNTTLNDDAAWTSRAGDPRYRLYKVQKNKPEGVDFGNVELDIDPWTEWPGDLGAPYEDLNTNGQWDPGTDIPQFFGDQMMWCVVNDVNRGKHSALGATSPIGLEVQILYFVFNDPGPLGDMMFMRWHVMNKSDADYDSCFFGMWSDPDLGDANDDLPGSDSLLSLGYIYNGDNDDGTATGYGATPPANGFDFFQGPIVEGEPTDTARFNGRLVPGSRNLPASSFVVYTNGSFASIIDPPDASPNYARIAYDYHLGKQGTAGIGITRPDGTPYPTFWFSGDPVAGTGDLPTNFPPGNFDPQDIRVMINTGPYTLAQGDTQEVVGVLLHAQGADRLQSVALLKQVDAIAQNAFDNNFQVPSAPEVPEISVSELDRQIIFNWTVGADETESYRFDDGIVDYRFEGYNFYQGESVNGPWTRIATYDSANGITLIEDFVPNLEAGKAYLTPVQFGEDAGLRRYYVVNQDVIRGVPLVNGRSYYFALTTYAYNWKEGAQDLGLRLALENAKDAVTVTPRGAAISDYVPTTGGDVLPHSRLPDDALIPEVIDPNQITGQTYAVVVDSPATSWSLIRAGSDTLVRSSTEFQGDATSPLVDGVLWKMTSPPAGVRTDDQTPTGWRYDPGFNAWSAGAGRDGAGNFWDASAGNSSIAFPNGQDLGDLGLARSTVPASELRMVEIRFSSTETSQAYRYLNNVPTFPPKPIVDSSFLPYINEKGGGLVYQKDYDVVTVPFTAWEVDPSDGDPTPRRLNVGFTENNDSVWSTDGALYFGLGAINAQWEPTTGTNGALEAIYVFSSDYSGTEDSTYTVNPANGRPINLKNNPVDIYYIVQVRKTNQANFYSDGDRIIATPNYALFPGETFGVETQARVQGVELATVQMGNINVFPNPYFGRNEAEQNQFNRFVTITHLPQVATIRVFTITGEIVRTLNHSDDSTFERWDLRNENGLPVASGVYILYIEIPEAGNRILKLAVIQPEERAARI